MFLNLGNVKIMNVCQQYKFGHELNDKITSVSSLFKKTYSLSHSRAKLLCLFFVRVMNVYEELSLYVYSIV